MCPEDVGICLPYYLCGDGQLENNTLSLDDPNNPCRYTQICCPFSDIHEDRITEAPPNANTASDSPVTTPTNSRPFTLKPTIEQNFAGNRTESRPKCGMRNRDGVGFRIADARDNEAEFGEFPWMVALFQETEVLGRKSLVYKCGGSLIHPKVVLTATHCVNKKQTIIARAGEWDTQEDEENIPKQDRRVSEVILHEGFHKGGLFNDIGLLILEDSFEVADNVGFICLPKPSTMFDSVPCVASGWGVHTQGGAEQTILKKVDLPIVPRQRCQDLFRVQRKSEDYQLHESYLCAGGQPGKDTCKGDGGSPLVCPTMLDPDQYMQAGVVSWGRGCGTAEVPGVYANVAVLRDWVDLKMKERKLDTSYYSL